MEKKINFQLVRGQIPEKVTLSGYDLVTRLIDVLKPHPCFKSTCAFRNLLY